MERKKASISLSSNTRIKRFIKEVIKMNKKIVGIVAAAIVLILAIVIAVFALKGKDTNKSIAVVEQVSE